MTTNYAYIYKYVNTLKKNNITVDMAFLSKFKQLIKYADRQKSPFALIIGNDEVEKGIALLKNMVTGEQKEVTLDNIVSEYNK